MNMEGMLGSSKYFSSHSLVIAQLCLKLFLLSLFLQCSYWMHCYRRSWSCWDFLKSSWQVCDKLIVSLSNCYLHSSSSQDLSYQVWFSISLSSINYSISLTLLSHSPQINPWIWKSVQSVNFIQSIIYFSAHKRCFLSSHFLHTWCHMFP